MDNAFIYLGRDQKIQEETAQFGKEINRAYLELLGRERYQQLVNANERLLTQDAYFEDVSQLERIGVNVPNKTTSKFIMATLSDKPQVVLDDLTKEILAAPAFYVSQESFRNSGSSKFTDKPIATYIHEFNHYLSFALQRVPMYMVSSLIAQKTDRQLTTDNLESYLYGAIMDASPVVEKQRRIALALTQGVLTQAYEQINDIIDAKILNSIGIQKKNTWRGKPKEFHILPIPGIGTFSTPVGGDSFYGLTDKEAFERFMKWEDHYNFRGAEFRNDGNSLIAEVNKLMNNTKQIKIKRVKLSDIEAMEESCEVKR